MTKFNLADDYSDFYQREGYVVIRDAFDAAELAAAKADLFELFETRLQPVNDRGLKGLDLLTEFYTRDRQKWQQCARRMFDLLSIYRLATKPQVLDIVRTLGLRRPMISTRPEVRTDMPADTQYTQPWHQDWRYGQGSLNSVTFWVPMHDVGVENGTVDVMPATHTLGYIDCEELLNPRRFSIPEAVIAGRPFFPAILKQGEALVFSQMLVHRSGFNSSGVPRLTTQIRFVDYLEPRFVLEGLPSPQSSDLLWARTPSAADMVSVFPGVSASKP
jgi:ectoine hydroxylase-related dioxygenase (phytanoyl-CoA dioxygenase family)